jgi:hypothetical protein
MDDVLHLEKNAREESFLFVVDSATRDAVVFPTPSEYEISFTAPFRNVFGIDLIDASVPRTEYTVERTRNALEYAMGHPTSLADRDAWYAANRRTLTLTPGDYNLPQLVAEITRAFAAAAAAAHDSTPIVAEAYSNPAEISNKIRLRSASAFTIFTTNSTIRHILGFGNPTNIYDTTLGSVLPDGTIQMLDATGEVMYLALPGWTATSSTGNDTFLSAPRIGAIAEPAFTGPLPIEEGLPVYTGHGLRQYFTAATSGPVRSVSVATTSQYLGAEDSYGLTVSIRSAASPGTAIVSGTLTPGADPRQPASVSFAGTAALVAGTRYVLQMTAISGTSDAYVAVCHARSNLETPLPNSMVLYVGTTETDTGFPYEELCADVLVAVSDHTIVTPNVVNLTGERFVSVRSPDIEQHMYRDRAFEKHHAGMGIVKMGGYGYRDQRFDFISFPPRRFHAIGKLSKLTIRIERPDGTLYDAHGIDHTLTFVLRYYAAAPVSMPKDSILNPAYNPDIRQYLVEDRWKREEDVKNGYESLGQRTTANAAR